MNICVCVCVCVCVWYIYFNWTHIYTLSACVRKDTFYLYCFNSWRLYIRECTLCIKIQPNTNNVHDRNVIVMVRKCKEKKKPFSSFNASAATTRVARLLLNQFESPKAQTIAQVKQFSLTNSFIHKWYCRYMMFQPMNEWFLNPFHLVILVYISWQYVVFFRFNLEYNLINLIY